MGQPNTLQNRYRWRNDDGTETGATWKAAIDTGWTVGLSDLDVPIRLRIEVANTGSKDEASGNYQIYLSKNSGAYEAITTTSTNGVKSVASGYSSPPSDNSATTEQMAGSQTFQAGQWDNSGETGAIILAATRDTELEFCIQLDSANLASGDTLAFRVYLGGAALGAGYTVTPNLTVPTLPTAAFSQANFRIRPGADSGDAQGLNDNGAGDWAAALNTNATLQSDASREGLTFGLRMEFEETAGAAGTLTPVLQYRLNGGTWYDIPWEYHNNQNSLVTSYPIGVFPTDLYTDGAATTNILAGSSKTFVAGTGEHTGTAAGVSLNNQHTEVEWRVFIKKLWDTCGNGHLHGDYYEFRVTNNGTPLDTYSYYPRVTLDYDNDYIGGCYPESIGDYGPIEAPNGHHYVVVEEDELTGVPKMCKRTSGTNRWVVMDNGSEPAIDDLEGFSIQLVGTTLHMFWQGGTTRYATFNTVTDQWGLDEQVDSVASANQYVSGWVRSDNTVVCIYGDASDHLVYKVRTSGVWDSTPTTIDSSNVVNGMTSVLAASDKIYIAWTLNETTIYSQSLNSSGTLGTKRTISSDPRTSGSGTQWSVIQPVYWDDSGNEKVGIIYQVQTDAKLYWRVITNDGTPGTEASVSDNACLDNATYYNSRQPAANSAVNGTDIYVVYVDETTRDLYYTVSSNGGTFDTDTELVDAHQFAAAAAQVYSSTLGYITEESYFSEATDQPGYTGGIQIRELALSDTTDELIADNITTTPVVDTPAIGQEHALDATDISTTPVVDTPAIGQEHVLVATEISTTPVVGTPVLSETHALDATDISTTPAVDTPAIGQEHVLDAADISTTPVVGTPVLSETHALDATDISTTPVVDTPAIGQEHVLVATEISTTPVVDTPAIGQEHVLDAADISTTPMLGTPALSETHALDATDISTTPVVDTPALGVIHNLVASDILSGPVVDTPTIGQEHDLTAQGITTTPVVGTPELTEGQIHNLVANDISATPVVDTPIIGQEHDLITSGISASPTVDTPAIGEIHNLDATEISTTPVVDTPALGVIHNLDASDINTTPILDTPSIGQEHDLTTPGITTTPVLGNPVLSTEGVHAFTASDLLVIPEVGNPALGQTHMLSATGISITPTVGMPILSVIHNMIATDITTTPVLETPAVGQIHALLANGISSGPVVGTPILAVIHVLTANSIVVIPIVETPQLGQIHVLNVNDILVLPTLEIPSLGQTHVLLPNGIITTPELGHPSLDVDLIEYPVGIVASAVYPTAEVDAILPTILVSISMED